MTDDAYAPLDNARREFIAAADRLSNAIARGDRQGALAGVLEAHDRLAELQDVLNATGEA